MAHEGTGYHFDILDHKNMSDSKTKDSFQETVVAEWNFRVIQEAARKVANDTLLGRFCGTINIQPLEDLIDDLICLIRILRRDISQNRSQDFFNDIWEKQWTLSPKEFPAASITASVPQRLTDVDHYHCLCPLTVLLQIIARSLNKMRLDSVSPDRWGAIKPLREALVRLQKNLVQVKDKPKKSQKKQEKIRAPQLPGFAPCIMLHEEHSHFTVTSTAPSYQSLIGLNTWGRKVRFAHLGQMMTRCSRESVDWIENMENLSQMMIENFNDVGGRRMPEFAKWVNPFENIPTRTAVVGGSGASFAPWGDYKLACIVDYWRFEMERPPGAQEEEQVVILHRERGSGSATSCAEWELWVHKLSRPPVRPPPPRQRLPMREGMAKSETWRVSNQPPGPQLPPQSAPSKQQMLSRQFQSPYPPVATRSFPERSQRTPTPEITQSMISRSGAHLIEKSKGRAVRDSETQSCNLHTVQNHPIRTPPADHISPSNTFVVQRPPSQEQRPRVQQNQSKTEDKGSFRSRFFKF